MSTNIKNDKEDKESRSSPLDKSGESRIVKSDSLNPDIDQNTEEENRTLRQTSGSDTDHPGVNNSRSLSGSKRQETSETRKENNLEEDPKVKPKAPGIDRKLDTEEVSDTESYTQRAGVNSLNSSNRQETSKTQTESNSEEEKSKVKAGAPGIEQNSGTEENSEIGSNTGQTGVNSSFSSSNRQETSKTQKICNSEEEDLTVKTGAPGIDQKSVTGERSETEKPDPELKERKQSEEQKNSDGQPTDETNKLDGSNKPVILTEKDVKEVISVEITKLKEDLQKDSLDEKEEKSKAEKDLKGFLSGEITKLKEDLKQESLEEKKEKSKTEKDVKEFLSGEITKLKEDLKQEYLEEKGEKDKSEKDLKGFLSGEITKLKEELKKESVEEKEEKDKSEKDLKGFLSGEITKLKEELKKESVEEKEEKGKSEKDLKGYLSGEITKLKEELKQESLEEKEEKDKSEKDLRWFLSGEITKLKEELKQEYLEEKEEKTKRSRKTMPQPFPFTTICVTSLIWIGWSYFYSVNINHIPPELAEFATQYKNFCDVNQINDKKECLKTFKYQQIINESYDETAKHKLEMEKLSTTFCILINDTQRMKSDQIALEQKVNKTANITTQELIATHENLTKLINVTKIELEKLIIDAVERVQEFFDIAKADNGIMYLVTIILAIGELCIFVVLCTKGAKQVPALRKIAENNCQAGDTNMPNGLDDIQTRADSENALCIVSFFKSTQAKHYQMVNSFIDHTIEKRSFLVNRHEDLKDIPASKICMVFVDYNARNIILESEMELGDIRKTTVKAIWKIGGNVVLVYCGDDYSQVTDNALYNHTLTSIKEQEELKQLETKQCVLSVKDNAFSDFQKKHLKDLIQRFFNQ